jgi:RNA polymerase sigma-70 factor (ECF subfamily)
MIHRDADRFSILLDTHGPLVWRTLWRILRTGDDAAAECFQETFLDFLRTARRHDIQRPAGLLVRIATRRAIDRVRSRAAERRRRRQLSDEEPSATSAEPWQAASGQELAEALRIALVALPEQQSAAFVMTQLEQLSHEDAAAVLGITVNHLAVLLFRARAALRERLRHVSPAERK